MGIVMGIVDDFSDIVSDYETRLFNKFKEIIDSSLSIAREENMNPLDTYLFVNNKVEEAYKMLAYVLGDIAYPEFVQEVDPPVSDRLMEKIDDYINPLCDLAINEIQRQFDEVMSSSNLGEFMEKYEAFKNMLSEKNVKDFMYEDIKIKKRV
jgi:hypothetical protein